MPALLHRCHAPAPDDAAHHLRLGGARIDDTSGTVAADHPAEPQEPELGIDCYFDENCTESAHRHSLAMLGGIELPRPDDLACRCGAHGFGDRRSVASAFA